MHANLISSALHRCLSLYLGFQVEGVLCRSLSGPPLVDPGSPTFMSKVISDDKCLVFTEEEPTSLKTKKSKAG